MMLRCGSRSPRGGSVGRIHASALPGESVLELLPDGLGRSPDRSQDHPMEPGRGSTAEGNPPAQPFCLGVKARIAHAAGLSSSGTMTEPRHIHQGGPVLLLNGGRHVQFAQAKHRKPKVAKESVHLFRHVSGGRAAYDATSRLPLQIRRQHRSCRVIPMNAQFDIASPFLLAESGQPVILAPDEAALYNGPVSLCYLRGRKDVGHLRVFGGTKKVSCTLVFLEQEILDVTHGPDFRADGRTTGIDQIVWLHETPVEQQQL